MLFDVQWDRVSAGLMIHSTGGGNGCIFSCILAAERARISQPEPIIVEMNRLKVRKTGVVGTFSRPPVSTAHPLLRF